MKKQKMQKQKPSKTQKPLYVKVCPKCNSINVEISHQGFLSGLVALGLPTVYRCRDCGFSANSFPEVNLNEVRGKKYKIRKI